MNPKLHSYNNRNKKARSKRIGHQAHPGRPGHRVRIKDQREAKKRKALWARESGATVREAASLAGVAVSTLYHWIQTDPEFAQAWNTAHIVVTNDLEMRAIQGALKGDRSLLMFLLRSYKPETYHRRQFGPGEESSEAIARMLAAHYRKREEAASESDPSAQILSAPVLTPSGGPL